MDQRGAHEPGIKWLPLTVFVLYAALCLVPFAIVVWKDFTTDAEDEPETLVPPRIRLLVAAALVLSTPFLVLSTPFLVRVVPFVWLLQMASFLGTAWLIAPTKYRRWFVGGSLLGTPVLLSAVY